MNRPIKQVLGLFAACICALSCNDDPSQAGDCLTTGLPFAGNENAPRVVDVTIDVQPDDIVLLATVTDPQGSENIDDVIQQVGLFPDRRCAGTPIRLQDDLACSGCEESFGTAFTKSQNRALYDQIDAATSWPVEVDFSDLNGNRTAGRVMAGIVH